MTEKGMKRLDVFSSDGKTLLRSYPLEDTPFAICKNNDELIASVNAYDDKIYQNKLKEYLDKLGCIEDGEASKRVIKLIEKNRISVD